MGKHSSRKTSLQLNYLSDKTVNRIEAIIIVALAAVIFYPPYLQGLFFEKHILPTGMFVFSLFIIFCYYKLLKKENVMLISSVDYIALTFVVVYFISIFAAVHTRSAIIEFLKYCMYFAVFYMVTDIAISKKARLMFLWAITASAVGVSIIGLDSAIGGNLAGALNRLFNFFGTKSEVFFGLFVGNRINSTLQYPNALASYLLAIFFVVIGIILSSKKQWVKAIGGASAYILFLTFMLTESRGAQIFFPIALIIFVIVSPKGLKIKSASHVILIAIPAVFVSLVVGPYLSGTIFSIRAMLLMATGLFVTVLLTFFINKTGNLLQKIDWKIYLALTSALIIVLSLGLNTALNSSIPLQLSHTNDEPDGRKLISRNIVLDPGKEYILSFTAEAKKQEEKPYAYSVMISSKSKENVLFSGETQLDYQTYQDSSFTENSIKFTVPEDSNHICIVFVNYFSGTEVTLYEAKIIDSLTGRTIKEIALKNKYNLDNIFERFNNLKSDGSGLTRFIYYTDGMKMLSRNWLFGAGGGAWEYLYRQFQSFNYMSTQAHNYPLQLAIETGILGLLALILLIVALYFSYAAYCKKNTKKGADVLNDNEYENCISDRFLYASIITAITSLFLHSTIDFDFSEASMLMLFWQLIAILNSEIRNLLPFKEIFSFTKKTRHASKIKSEKIGLGICAVFAIALLITTVRFSQGSFFAKKAFDNLKENNIEEAISNMFKAIEKDKFNERYVIGYNPIESRPDIKTGLADLLLMKNDLIENRKQNGEQITQTELSQFQQQFSILRNYLEQVQKVADHNLPLSSNLAAFSFSIGQIDKGIEYLDNCIKLYPFEPYFWAVKVNIYHQLMVKSYTAEDYDRAKKYLDAGLDIIHKASITNGKNMNPFTFDEDTIDKLQMLQFFSDSWGEEGELSRYNQIVHYTVPYMDLNQDNIPDQWQCDNSKLIRLTAGEDQISVQVTGDGFIFTKNQMKLKKGEKYIVEVELDREIETLSYEITDLINITPLELKEQGLYTGAFKVDDETEESQLRLYFKSDCNIKKILIFKEE